MAHPGLGLGGFDGVGGVLLRGSSSLQFKAAHTKSVMKIADNM
jgi:hypothetical protein